ncbi:MAG: hypothetical protein AB7M12_13545, partial [Hyphomonadaceae bacterium]
AATLPLPGMAHGLRPNALPLARRLEALLRLAQDRARAVRRLARRLQDARRENVAARFARYRFRAPFRETLDEAQQEVDRIAAPAPADTS